MQSMVMKRSGQSSVAYWVFTVLFAVPMIGSGVGYLLLATPVVQGMAHLGYPMYLIRFLGVAKILGAVAILSAKSPRLKEWAYAGFFFDLVGAAYSHWCSDDGPKALLPLVMLMFVALSYHFGQRLALSSKTHVGVMV